MIINEKFQRVYLFVSIYYLVIEARVHNPIPVEEFNNHVSDLRKDGKKEFKLEFEVTLF